MQKRPVNGLKMKQCEQGIPCMAALLKPFCGTRLPQLAVSGNALLSCTRMRISVQEQEMAC